MIIHEPFTEDQIKSLNEFQQRAIWHPFTCGNNHAEDDLLIAAETGWVCPNCDYTQDWAHDFMANWDWKKTSDAFEDWKKRACGSS
jgi:hypothetical protein